MMYFTQLAWLVGLSSFAAASLYGESDLTHTCLLVPPYLSCSAQANPTTVDSCCVETYGGLVLSAQYWDTYTGLESQGQLLPPQTWGLHGLWPDFCNGSYTQYCDLSRQYDPYPSPSTTNDEPNGTVIPPYTGPPVTTFLETAGRYDLLSYMNHYWINQGYPNWEFWAHEFSKHGTCYSSFDLPCYGPQYVNHSDVIQFWETAIQYYMKVPTWEWLEAASITPSNTTNYTLSDIQSALTDAFGAVPYLGCYGPEYRDTAAGKAAGSDDKGYTILDEVWYYHHVYGRIQTLNAIPINATAPVTTCATAKGAIMYPLRTNGSEWKPGSYVP